MTQSLLAALALIGTALQAWDSVTALRDTDHSRAFRAIDQLRSEVSIWRLRRWREHRRLLRALRTESPAEWASYWRLWRLLMSWSILTVVAGCATIAAAADWAT